MKRKILILSAVFLLSSLAISACGKVDPENCKHPTHDQDAICLDCGKQRSHDFVNGTCSICSLETPFLWRTIRKEESLLAQIKANDSSIGTLESFTYETPAFNIEALTGEKKTIEKTAHVYLPSGYDPSKQYDLVVLLHGSEDNENYWFSQGEYKKDDIGTFYNTGNLTKELLDYMHAKQMIKPTIFVTPSLYNEAENFKKENSVVAKEFAKEMTDYLLPSIVTKYSTYVNGTTKADFISARDHLAYCGLSMGGFTGLDSALSQCLPYFSYFGIFSGNTTDVDTLIQNVNRDSAQYPIGYLYVSCGVNDQTVKYNGVKETYAKLISEIPALKKGKNTCMVDIASADHTYECFLTALYNAMQVLFK